MNIVMTSSDVSKLSLADLSQKILDAERRAITAERPAVRKLARAYFCWLKAQRERLYGTVRLTS